MSLQSGGFAGDRLVHLSREGHGLMLQLLGTLATLDAVLVKLGHTALRQADKLDALLADVLGHRLPGTLDHGVLGDADLVLLVDVGVLPHAVAVTVALTPVDVADLGGLGAVLNTLLLLRPAHNILVV